MNRLDQLASGPPYLANCNPKRLAKELSWGGLPLSRTEGVAEYLNPSISS